MEDSQLVYSDLTRLEGEPTPRAHPRIERIEREPATPSGAAITIMLVAGAGLVALAATAGVGIWVGASATLVLICSVLAFALGVVSGVFAIGRNSQGGY